MNFVATIYICIYSIQVLIISHLHVLALIMKQKYVQKEDFNLVFATRIHLGQQKEPTPQDQLNQNVLSFLTLAQSSGALRSAIAVDTAEKIPGYDLVHHVRIAVDQACANLSPLDDTTTQRDMCDILPTTPWGSFVPALNVLVRWACSYSPKAERIAFLSLETKTTADAIIELCRHVTLSDILVAGAALPGHEHHSLTTEQNINDIGTVVELTGRTCPWNTLAIWNLKQLAITGFPLLADGLHLNDDGSPGAAGIEEFSTILLHQRIFEPQGPVKAKLVKITQGLNWEQTFQDEERKKWHEFKMQTKYTRAKQHRKLLGGLTGSVVHL